MFNKHWVHQIVIVSAGYIRFAAQGWSLNTWNPESKPQRKITLFMILDAKPLDVSKEFEVREAWKSRGRPVGFVPTTPDTSREVSWCPVVMKDKKHMIAKLRRDPNFQS